MTFWTYIVEVWYFRGLVIVYSYHFTLLFTRNKGNMTGITWDPPGAHGFTPGFSWDHVSRSLVFCVVFCHLLFVFLYFFFWLLLYCLSFDLRFLITPLVSSYFCYNLYAIPAHGLKTEQLCKKMLVFRNTKSLTLPLFHKALSHVKDKQIMSSYFFLLSVVLVF